VDFNTLTSVNAQSAGRGVEIYRFLRNECGSRFMQFIPIVERVPNADVDGRCRGPPGATARCTGRAEIM